VLTRAVAWRSGQSPGSSSAITGPSAGLELFFEYFSDRLLSAGQDPRPPVDNSRECSSRWPAIVRENSLTKSAVVTLPSSVAEQRDKMRSAGAGIGHCFAAVAASCHHALIATQILHIRTDPELTSH
jgi:hypothetical protein